MLVDIDKIVVGDRIRKDFGDIAELAEDIRENGLINPPVVNKEYVLLAGERRLRACKLLGWPQIEVRMMDTRDAEHDLDVEISENECRKEFTKTERLDYARRLARIESAKAKERMAEGGRGGKSATPSTAGKTRDKVAEHLGTSATQLRQEQFIADNADLLDPADFADWDEGKLSTNKAFQRIKAAQEQAEKERDAARKEASMAEWDAAELRRKLTEVRDEVEALEKQNDELYDLTQQQQVVEREVVREVVPEDYEDIKRHVRELENGNRLYSDESIKLRNQLEEARRELDKAKNILGMNQAMQDVRRDVHYLIAATNTYVRQYGGLTWTVQKLSEVDEPTLDELRVAVTNLATFSNALVASLEDFNASR